MTVSATDEESEDTPPDERIAQWLLRVTTTSRGRQFRVSWRDDEATAPRVERLATANAVLLHLRNFIRRGFPTKKTDGQQ